MKTSTKPKPKRAAEKSESPPARGRGGAALKAGKASKTRRANPKYGKAEPSKVPVSVRIDTDVVAWLKRGGKGYQTRLNAILRQAMARGK
jgi:uncharacterized protein (DUF4415 family)